MSNFEEFISARIRNIGGYAPGKPIKQAEKESGVKCIKMASNENPFGPSPRALEAIQKTAGEVNLYPDNEVSELRARLAQAHGVQPANIVVTAGSTTLLDVVARTVLDPGSKAITSERSFIVYPIVTKLAGAELVQVPMNDDTYDLNAIAAAVDDKTRLVFLANPNNPTGTMVSAPAIDRFFDKLPPNVLVVLDEAYADFAQDFTRRRGASEYSHSIEYVCQNRPVMVLRTFSKAHGLAGVRVGYGIGPVELVATFSRVRTAFMVSAVAEAAAIAALEDRAHLAKSIENNAAGAEWLMSQLSDMGYKPVETWANFIYVDVGEDSVAVAKRMQAAGVIIRPLSVWGAKTAIRVSIGTPEQNTAFVKALKKVMAVEVG
jgi:histidinol-phosphate aminotransferase